jgi:hypothetical protein
MRLPVCVDDVSLRSEPDGDDDDDDDDDDDGMMRYTRQTNCATVPWMAKQWSFVLAVFP